ncbi:hypothetical protein H257_17043, partial [Aphanomyces astaci]
MVFGQPWRPRQHRQVQQQKHQQRWHRHQQQNHLRPLLESGPTPAPTVNQARVCAAGNLKYPKKVCHDCVINRVCTSFVNLNAASSVQCGAEIDTLYVTYIKF